VSLPREASQRLGLMEVGLVGAVALAGIVVARSYSLWRDQFQVLCPAWTIFSVPCPTCGATRAVVAAMQGELLAAFAWNPLAALMAVGAVLALPLTAAVLIGVVPAPRVPTSLGVGTRTLLIAVLAANWMYLLRYFSG